MLLFLDHILCRSAHFVRDALRASRAVLAIKKSVAKLFLKTLYNLGLHIEFGLCDVISLQYGGIHDSHFKHIQTTITSLFLGQF